MPDTIAPARSWQVLLLGGAPGAGKTSISYRLARYFDIALTIVIANHLERHTPLVLEGDFIESKDKSGQGASSALGIQISHPRRAAIRISYMEGCVTCGAIVHTCSHL